MGYRYWSGDSGRTEAGCALWRSGGNVESVWLRLMVKWLKRVRCGFVKVRLV